jgi:hypothetical protein
MIDFLLEITLLFSFSFVVACFNYAFEVWISPGHIFQRWGYFLARNESKAWSKPLGLCVMCCNVWCEMIAFSIVVAVIGSIELIWLIPASAVVGNAWLRKVLN